MDLCLEPQGLPCGFRPRRRWLITELEGLSWEARTRVAGHLSGGKAWGHKTHENRFTKDVREHR